MWQSTQSYSKVQAVFILDRSFSIISSWLLIIIPMDIPNGTFFQSPIQGKM